MTFIINVVSGNSNTVNIYYFKYIMGDIKLATLGSMSSLVTPAVNAFMSKLGGGISSASVGLIMGIAGYDGSLAVQEATTKFSIVALFNYVPMILMVLLLILGILYKIDKELPKAREELRNRHSSCSEL